MGQSPESAATARLTRLPNGPSWDLSGNLVLVGGSRQNDIVLNAHGVSRFHVRLRRVDNVWQLEDDGSRNGTWSGETRLTRYSLSHGDELRLGEAELRFEDLTHELPRHPWAGPGPASPASWASWASWADLASRRPMLIAGVVAAAAALVMCTSVLMGSTERISVPVRGAQGDVWEQALAQLRGGELVAASKLFRGLSVRGPVSHRSAPRILHRLSKLLAEERPEAFRWKTAAELLDRAERIKDLPDATRDWIRERSAWVESGRREHSRVEVGQDAERRAKRHQEAGELNQAIAALDEALSAYGAVDPRSPFGPLATHALTTLRAEAFRVLVGEAHHVMAIDPPEFDSSLALIRRADEHATSQEQRIELRSLRAACLRNQQDLANCQRAVRIITGGRIEAYPEALEILKHIDPRSQASAEARMWSEWLEADTDTRRADQLYAQGDARSALRLLDKVQATRLDAAALDAVLERRERWTNVARAWERARQLSRDGDPHTVQTLEEVLRLEGATANHYNRLARRELSHIAANSRDHQRITLERGLKALRSGDYPTAHRAFEAVRLDPARDRDDCARIARAVREANDERHLLSESRHALMADSVDRFEELRVQFELLSRWLHPKDPQRAVAKKCLRALARRRAVLERIQAQERAS